MKFIDEMRERPEEERLALAVLIAGAVAIVLFLIWGATFFNSDKNIAKIEVTEQRASAVDGLRDIGSEITKVTNEFSTQYDQFRRALDEAGLGGESQGVNTVDLYVDDDGNVHVDNIIVEDSELETEE